ncbi:peptide chain release factor 1 [Strigomonas culicis]|nr:peptide chain release factor 1 [Strigomonas culicis]|eukprot:EPY30543.1 peptide chain release factor 1 [Strigomonas culicis]
MERRLRSEDVVGSSSKTWTCTVAGKAGGEEAGLFASELAEMFKAYAKEFREMRVSSGEDADQEASGTGEGTVSGTFKFQLTGNDVYRNFHHEIGVHKVQRVPVTDAAGKMQTSTAVFTMMPVLDPVAVNVHESDCKIDFVRGSGPGGQGMQSSSNCVVLTHKPTGISVKCHQSRSALGNKELALQMVAQQILAQKVREQHSSLHAAWSSQWSSGERSDKMRTYNYPQNRVTDHRLGKDYSLSTFMERGSGLVGLHDEFNDINDREQLCSVLLKHIKNEFGSTV